MKQETLYCSLDIETTGFDPLKEEILEVGFVFFTIGDKGIKITEEWTQVFKPAKTPSPQILALTGITQEELAEAPKFSGAGLQSGFYAEFQAGAAFEVAAIGTL